MLKRAFLIALLAGAWLSARALESLSLPSQLPPLDKRGNWRETLEDLAGLGIPQNWTILGPVSNENAKSFEKKLQPELTDDWNIPLTDNLGRLFHVSVWSKPKDDDGCYVDLFDTFPTPPSSPVACALTIIESPVDGPALLWFENVGHAIVYFNNRMILTVPGRVPKSESAVHALFPLPVELKRGRNYLKIKVMNEKKQSLKGWGFYARIERNDLEWRKLLLAKLKELYPGDDLRQTGAQERLILARRYEISGDVPAALLLYKQVAENYGAFEDASNDARDALKRLENHAPIADPVDASKAWIDSERKFRAALATGQTLLADRLLRDFAAQFSFSEEAGIALCFRGGLRLDYACEESARPFYEQALREYSSNELVRTFGTKGLEFARFYMPEHAKIETDHDVQAALASLQRQLRNGNAHDNAAGLKAFAELLNTHSGSLVHAGGSELYPRCASVNLLVREYLKTLSPEEGELFREPLIRASEIVFRRAKASGDPREFEEIAHRFPGTAAAARALNTAGNVYLDRGLYPQAVQAFQMLLREFKGSGLIVELTVKAKESQALKGLEKFRATQSECETFASNIRRLGAASGSPAPLPGTLAWLQPVKLSEFAVRARNGWPEDKTYAHIEPFPVSGGGRIYLATRESVRALDAANGKELWNKSWGNAGYVMTDKFSGYPQTLPVLKEGKLFVRGISGEKSSIIRCYDAASGNVEWDTEKLAPLRSFVWSSEPLVAYNLVIAAYFEPLDHDTVRCGAAGLDARTGRLVWNRTFGVGNTGVSIAQRLKETRYLQSTYRVTLQLGPPSAYQGMVYTATGLGSLAALNASTGEVCWISDYPRLRAGNLATGNSGIEGFMPRMLKVLARGPSSPVVGETTVVLAPRDAAGIVGFDRRTGELRWAHELLDARFIAGVCSGKLLAVDDTITALDLETGAIAWEYSAEGNRLAGQPGFSGDTLYLPYIDGLHVVDAMAGKLKTIQKWDPKSNGPLANILISGTQIVGVNNTVLASINVK